jgi:hypothetical protein
MLKATEMVPTSEHNNAGKALLLIIFVEALREERGRITETKL